MCPSDKFLLHSHSNDMNAAVGHSKQSEALKRILEKFVKVNIVIVCSCRPFDIFFVGCVFS